MNHYSVGRSRRHNNFDAADYKKPLVLSSRLLQPLIATVRRLELSIRTVLEDFLLEVKLSCFKVVGKTARVYG